MATPRKAACHEMVTLGEDGFPPAETYNSAYDPGQVGMDELSDDLALMNTLAQIGESESEAKVNVYQIDAAKKDVFLYSCSVGEFASNGLEEIQQRYGAGDYRIRVYNGGRVLTHRRVPVGAPRIVKEEVKHNGGADIAAMFAQQSALMLEGFKQLATALAPQSHGPSKQEILQEMMMYKELFGGGAQPAQAEPPMQIMLDMLKQGMELGRMGGGEPSSLDILSKAVDTFAPVVSAIAAQRQAPQAAPAMPQSMAALPNPLPAQPSPEPDVNANQIQLKMALGFLCKQAQANADPYTYACMVVDQVPLDELNTLLSQPDWLARLAQIEPATGNPVYAPWFDQLKVEITGILTSESDTGNTDGHAAIHQPEQQQPAED